ncbi:MAG: hypothetical protein CFE43_16465 [Burkholderiales bacterium PBB3]|nr:MAG: hypothetical protein CFE43_16465 [Burkholderiales bacterium PBB3]
MKLPPWFPHPNAAIEHALLVLGYRNLKVHVVGHIGLSVLIACGAWSAAPHARVGLWLALMLALSLGFGYGLWAFRKIVNQSPLPPVALAHWRRTNLFMAAAPGLGWGAVGFLLVPDAQVNNLMMLTAFAGAFAYSSVGNAHDLRGYQMSVSVATLVLMSQLGTAFGDQATVAVGMSLLFYAVMSWVARNAHFILLETISLRLANEQLAKTNADNTARAEQASRAKSEFFAAASHDLRQPVHALLLLIEAYRNQVPGAAHHPLILNIAAAGQSIATLFNALMELSRLESGQEKPIPSTFDLPDRMQRLLAQVRPVAHRNSLRLRSHTARAAAQLSITTDKVLFERIVGNLLSNALRYTAQGGVLLSLRRARGAPGWWLEVWDTGLGIADHDLDRIFDPYIQLANSERDRSKGLGLGLAIVQRASALLGITVTAHSRLGRGSCFRLHLPPHLFQHALLTTTPLGGGRHERTVQPAAWLQGKRVLLVDDDPMVQSAMRAVLGSWGLELRCAGVGDATVLDVCGPDWVPDCVLCDFRLPGLLDGIGMLDLLQEHFPHTVGILQTGELAQTVQARAADAGYMVLYKPVLAPVLESTLAAVLQPRTPEVSA